MRRLVAPLLALGLATPAVAAQPSPQGSVVADAAERAADALGDPRTGVAAEAVIDALLDLPVGRLVKAVEPVTRGAERVDDETTLGDLAARRDPNFRDNVRDRAPVVMDALAGVVRELARVAPLLEDAAVRAADTVQRGRDEVERRTPRR